MPNGRGARPGSAVRAATSYVTMKSLPADTT
jgi:hypothetical protein